MASQFLERLSAILQGLESGDTRIREGGDPTRNPREKNRKELEVYRIEYPGGVSGIPGGSKVYVRFDATPPELIIPKGLENEDLPSLLSELEAIAREKVLRAGFSVTYKERGSMEYQPVELPGAMAEDLEGIGERVLEQAGGKPQGAWGVLRRIEDSLRQMEKAYAAGYRRHQKALKELQQQVSPLSEQLKSGVKQITEFADSGADRITELADSLQELSRKLGNGVRVMQERLAALQRQADEWDLAIQVHALAQKCRNGCLDGVVYQLVTKGPDAFSVIEKSSGTCIITVRRDHLLSLPKVSVEPKVESSELRAMTAQLKHLNRTLGEGDVDQYLSQHEPAEVRRNFGNFAPNPAPNPGIEPPLERELEAILLESTSGPSRQHARPRDRGSEL